MNRMKMKIGILGCGGISHSHGTAASQSDLVKIVACADIIVSRGEEYAGRYSVENTYDSLGAMLESEELDLVILATWPAQHLEQIRKACDLGTKAILCEKSLGLNGDQGDEILGIVKESGVFLMEAFMYRHHPQIFKAKELVDNGAIGEIGYLRGQFTFPVLPDSDNWRAKKELGGGSMMDQGCYTVNALNHFAGADPVEVFCRTSLNADTGLDMGHTGTIVYSNGLVGQFESNQKACWREEIQICGSEGVIVIPRFILTAGDTRYIELQRGNDTERFDFEALNSYQLQLENIHECLFGSGRPNMPLEESVRNLHVISALFESGRTGKMEAVL